MSSVSSGGSPRAGMASIPIRDPPVADRRSHGPAPERVGARGSLRRPRERVGGARRRTRARCDGRDCAAWCSEANPESARPPCWRRSRNRWCRRPTRQSSTGDATRPASRSNRSGACWPTASSTHRSTSSPSTSPGAGASSCGSAHSSQRGSRPLPTRQRPTTPPNDSSCSRPRPISSVASRRRDRSC